MKLRNPAKSLLVGLGILLLCLPASFILTVATAPFWRWLETGFRIEAFGHSGPAEWCYWAVYCSLITLCSWVWFHLIAGKTTPRGDGNGASRA